MPDEEQTTTLETEATDLGETSNQPVAGTEDADAAQADPQTPTLEVDQSDETAVDNSTQQTTTPQTPRQSPEDLAAKYAELEARYSKLEAAYKPSVSAMNKAQQEASERARQLETFKGIDPQTVQAWKTAQKEAEQRKLPVWHPKHPDSTKAMDALARVESYRRALQAIPAEQREQLGPALAQSLGVTQDDVKTHAEFAAHRERAHQELSRDPEGWLETRAQPLIQREVQRLLHAERERMQAEQKVGNWFDNPANRPIIERYGPDMQQLIQGIRGGEVNAFDLARSLAEKNAVIEGLRAQINPAQRAAATASEKQRLLEARNEQPRRPVGHQRITQAAIEARVQQMMAERGLESADVDLYSEAEETLKANS